MKNVLSLLVMVILGMGLVMGATLAQAADKAVDLTGIWDLTVETSQGSGNPVLELKQEGDALAGIYSGMLGTVPLKGKVKGQKFEIKFIYGGMDIVYKGKSDGITMKGMADAGQYGVGTLTGQKK